MASPDNQNGDEAGKLFVGGLSWETTKESLSEYFSNFGKVIDCVVMKNNDTGKSRGFGFVTFEDPSNVDNVLAKPSHCLDKRNIDPKACNPKSMQLKNKKSNTHKIFLGGLPKNACESDLKAFFNNYGTVLDVTVMYDQEKKQCRGFGFITFDSEEAVKRSCANHFVHIKGKQVECKIAEQRTGSNNNRGMNQGMGGQWNNMGGQMNSGMGGPPGGYQGSWGNQQEGGFNQQGPPVNGFQNNGYGYSQPPYGGQQYGNNYNYGNFGNGPQGNNQGGPGYNNMGGGPGMGQNNMGGAGNMGNYPQEASNFGPARGFGGGGPMNQGGMQNSGYMQQGGGYNSHSGNYESSGNNSSNQNEGPPGGRGGAQQSQGYHPYRR